MFCISRLISCISKNYVELLEGRLREMEIVVICLRVKQCGVGCGDRVVIVKC